MFIVGLFAAWSVARMPEAVRIDLSGEKERRTVVDREERQYLGHVSTVRLTGKGADGRTILAVYPKGHGAGEIVLKKSTDGGRTWGERLPTPESWRSSRECPSIHEMFDVDGRRRLVVWSGLFPARYSVSEDDGATWSRFRMAAGDASEDRQWGGIVVMSCAEQGREAGVYRAWFHDDGRFFRSPGKLTKTFTLYQAETRDGGQTWGRPRAIYASDAISVCEPGTVKSPDGRTIAMLLREESRRQRSQIMFSEDDAEHWSEPRQLPLVLTGDKHTCRYTADGRLIVSFREHTVKGSITGSQDPATIAGASEWEGDWVLWVGTFDDLKEGREGQYKVRLMDNQKAWDCAYPGVEVLPDGAIVATTYGHWDKDQPPYIVSVRLTLAELDARAGKPQGR